MAQVPELARSESVATGSFGSWVRVRRRTLGITQAELASRVPCAAITIRKLEADERRPSGQMAERLAEALELDEEQTDRFVDAARTAFAPATGADELSDAARSVPAPTSPLVGRTDELDDAFARLVPAGGEARLLTITGPPGVGKTRLALELAQRIDDKLDIPVDWIDLAGVAEPASLMTAITRAVVPPGVQGAPADELAVRALSRGSRVVFLDNFEHLVEAAVAVSRLLAACRDLVCVTTSRSRLDLHGEHELALGPLPTVAPDGTTGAAVTLFVDRARQVTGRDPAPDDPLVRSIVERVGAFPLAIELAALRLRDYDLAGLDASLESGLAALGANRRGVPARHASLADAVAWSESLLDPTDRAVLEALAVFPSGADASAVAEVAGLSAADVAPALRTLEQAALVARTAALRGGAPRYAPFVVVREHVVNRLDPPRLAVARSRHAAVVLEAAEHALPGIDAWPEQMHMQALDDLSDDLHAALAWSFGPHGDGDVGVRIAVRAVSAWVFRGQLDDCRRWSLAALASRPESYMARYLAAVTDWSTGVAGAAGAMEAAFAGAEAAGDTVWVAECAGMAQTIALSAGDLTAATELGPRAVEAARAAGGEWEALVHVRSGGLALRRGDLDAARGHAERCVACYDAIGSTWGRATAAVLEGSVAEAEGRAADAAQAYLRALELYSTLGFVDYIAAAVADCGHLLLRLDRPREAATVYGLVEVWLDELGIDVQPMARYRWHTARRSAQDLLGAEYAELAARGAAMPRDLASVRGVLAKAGLVDR